jgi:hypothetical protein
MPLKGHFFVHVSAYLPIITAIQANFVYTQ